MLPIVSKVQVSDNFKPPPNLHEKHLQVARKTAQYLLWPNTFLSGGDLIGSPKDRSATHVVLHALKQKTVAKKTFCPL